MCLLHDLKKPLAKEIVLVVLVQTIIPLRKPVSAKPPSNVKPMVTGKEFTT